MLMRAWFDSKGDEPSERAGHSVLTGVRSDFSASAARSDRRGRVSNTPDGSDGPLLSRVRRQTRRSMEEGWELPSGRVPRARGSQSFQALMHGLLRSSGRRSTGRARAPVSGGSARSHHRRVTVKMRVAQVGQAWGQKAAKLHLRYLEREGVAQDGTPGTLYDAEGRIARGAMEQELPGEAHQFRLVVSPEDGHELDLETFVREFMDQVEQDLGRKLRWAAVNHYNTDQPHAHVLIRGVDFDGAEVWIDRAYISYGMRHRAEDLATEKLGLRPERSRLDQLRQETELERYTSLDRELERRAPGGVFSTTAGRRQDRHWEAALRMRLDVLGAMGLASPAGYGKWKLEPELRQRLQLMGRRAEALRALRGVVRSPSYRVIDRMEPRGGQLELERGVHGVVRWKGLDEDGRFVAVIETTGGVAYHLPVTNRVAADVRVGQLVEVKKAFDKDEHIEQLVKASGGTVELSLVREGSRDAYRRRLEQLERMKLAGADPAVAGRWVVRSDFRAELAQGKQQPLWQMLSVRSEQQSLASQPRYQGPVWLDRIVPGQVVARGFGASVQQALEERHVYLRSQGLDPADSQLPWRLLKLQRGRLEQALGGAGGGVPTRAASGFEGSARLHREPNGQRFLEIRSPSGQFVVVPAPPRAELLQGQTVRLEVRDKGRVGVDIVNRDRGLER